MYSLKQPCDRVVAVIMLGTYHIFNTKHISAATVTPLAVLIILRPVQGTAQITAKPLLDAV